MKQKLEKKFARVCVSIALSTNIFIMLISPASAASDPKFLFTQDCNTIDKQVSIGFQSNPDAPTAGQEIIAAKLTLILTPGAGVSFADIKNAALVKNDQYSNVVVAENSTKTIGESLEAKITIGFTGGTGVSNTKDIIFVRGIDKKAYTITIKEGELYPKNSMTNIYKNQITSFVADPKNCEAPTSPLVPTPAPAPTPPPASPTPPPVTQPAAPTEISITSDKTVAKIGDQVKVTALVSNRKGAALDWVQTTGRPLNEPVIKNEDIEGGKTQSVFSFSMPETKDLITLKLNVGTVNKSIAISPEPPLAAVPTPEADGEDDASTAASGTETLAERLRKRREALQNTGVINETVPQASSDQAEAETTALAEAQNIHEAAGDLNASGPRETLLAVGLGSIGVLYALRRRKTQAGRSS